MPIYLTSYHPLCINRIGLERAREHGIPPFVDASCRREPDLESELPSITSLCRGRNFAPRLQNNDVAVYITVKRDYLNHGVNHWRLTAILQVLERLDSHSDAATWYMTRHLPLPSNCIVPSNKPLSASKTAYKVRACIAVSNADQEYRERAKNWGTFLVCRTLYKELDNPPVISERILMKVFNRIPGTRTPPEIKPRELRSLAEQLGIARHVKRLDFTCPQ